METETETYEDTYYVWQNEHIQWNKLLSYHTSTDNNYGIVMSLKITRSKLYLW